MLPARDLPKGTHLGKFEVQEMIGRGGMGAVYRAWDAHLRRHVAIKTLAPVDDGAGQSDVLKTRFEREALAVGSVKHQNVVQMYDVGFAADGTPFIVMEHLEGKTLADLMKSRPGGLPITDAVEIMLGVCAGVSACHRRGIIHRDLKPVNVFLAKTDFQDAYEVKVLDFGVSAMVMEEDLTREGQIVGTPNYMSPEQARGKGDAAVDARSDQYTIGVLLYASAARRLPFQEFKHLELLHAICRGDFKPPREYRPEIPEGLEAVILRAMSLDPQARFGDVNELGRALLPFATERAQQKWTWMFSSTPHATEPTPARPAAPRDDGSGAVRSAAASRASTADGSSKAEPSTEKVSFTKTTVAGGPLVRGPAVPSNDVPGRAVEGAAASASRSVITSTKSAMPKKVELSSAAWNLDGEAPPPASAGAPAEEPAAGPVAAVAPEPAAAAPPHAAASPPAATAPPRRSRALAGAAGIAVVSIGLAFVAFRTGAEEPLGVRNIPAGSPVLVAPTPAPPAPPAQQVTPEPPVAVPARGVAMVALPQAASASSEAPRPVEPRRREKTMEAKRRKLPKVEVGTDGVPIPP